MSDAAPLLLYDGVCALCNWAVRFVLRFDRRGTMRFAPLSGPTAARVLAAHPDLARVDSLILVDGGRIAIRSAAVLGVVSYLGGPWKLLLVFRILPREIRDSLYDVVAFWRKRLFGRYEACPIPAAEVRDRFVS